MLSTEKSADNRLIVTQFNRYEKYKYLQKFDQLVGAAHTTAPTSGKSALLRRIERVDRRSRRRGRIGHWSGDSISCTRLSEESSTVFGERYGNGFPSTPGCAGAHATFFRITVCFGPGGIKTFLRFGMARICPPNVRGACLRLPVA